MRLDWCVESCDRIIGEIDICIFMDYRFGGRSDMLDIQISDTFMNNKSVAKIQQNHKQKDQTTDKGVHIKILMNELKHKFNCYSMFP